MLPFFPTVTCLRCLFSSSLLSICFLSISWSSLNIFPTETVNKYWRTGHFRSKRDPIPAETWSGQTLACSWQINRLRSCQRWRGTIIMWLHCKIKTTIIFILILITVIVIIIFIAVLNVVITNWFPSLGSLCSILFLRCF